MRAHDGPERWKEGSFVLELDFVDAEPTSDTDVDVDDPGRAFAESAQAQAQARAQARRIAHGLHRRTMSAVPDVDVRPRPKTPKNAGQGFRSLQAVAPRPLTQVLSPRRRDADEYDGRPFWKPR